MSACLHVHMSTCPQVHMSSCHHVNISAWRLDSFTACQLYSFAAWQLSNSASWSLRACYFLSFLQLSYSTGALGTGAINIRVAGAGWLSWTTAESLVDRVFANFCDKNIVFGISGKQAICGCQKTCTNTGTSLKHPYFWLALRYVSLYESSLKVDSTKVSESSTKALWKLSKNSLEALRKQADFW